MPVHGRVAREHRVAVRGGPHEPRGASVVQQRRIAAPAVRVRVHDAPRLPEYATPLQLLGEQRVGVLHEQAADHWQIPWELPARVHRLQEREIVALAGAMCTTPLPSSAETNVSPTMISCALPSGYSSQSNGRAYRQPTISAPRRCLTISQRFS